MSGKYTLADIEAHPDADINSLLEDAREIGVDPNLAYRMFRQESGMRQSAVSPKGAFGRAQLMPDTARMLQKKYGDDPATPRGNQRLGLYYLKEQLDEFGTPELAVAAYHAGPGNVRKAGNRVPGTHDGLIATKDHVARITGGLPKQGRYTLADIEDSQPGVAGDSGQPNVPVQPQPKMAKPNPLFGGRPMQMDLSGPDASTSASASRTSADMRDELPGPKPTLTARQRTENLLGPAPSKRSPRTVPTLPASVDNDLAAQFEGAKFEGRLDDARAIAGQLKAKGWEVGESGGWPYIKRPQGRREESSTVLFRDSDADITGAIAGSGKQLKMTRPPSAKELQQHARSMQRAPRGQTNPWKEEHLENLRAVPPERRMSVARQLAKDGPLTDEEREALGIEVSGLRQHATDILGSLARGVTDIAGQVGAMSEQLPEAISPLDYAGAPARMLAETVTGTPQPRTSQALKELADTGSEGLQAQQNIYGGQGYVPDIERALAGSAPIIAAGALGGGAALVGALGGLQTAGQIRQEAKAKGYSDKDATRVSLLGIPIGLTEMWGIGGASTRFARGQMIRSFVEHVLKESGEEASQEVVQQILQNLVAKGSYDPEREIINNDLPYQALIAAITGGLTASGFKGLEAARGSLQQRRDVDRADSLEALASSLPSGVPAEHHRANSSAPTVIPATGLQPEGTIDQTIPVDVAQTNIPTPEHSSALAAQMEALQQGRRKAVLVTPGEEMPAMPDGYKTVKTKDGVFIYNPAEIKGGEILDKYHAKDYGDLLGHVEPKPEPEEESAIIAATDPKTGAEIQTSVVSPDKAEKQAEALKQQFPQADVQVGGEELAAKVIADREMASVESAQEPDLTQIRGIRSNATNQPSRQRSPDADNLRERIERAAPNESTRDLLLSAAGLGDTSQREGDRDFLQRVRGHIQLKGEDSSLIDEILGAQPEKAPVDQAAHTAATSPSNNAPEPTEAQKEAGNYLKGHTRISGLDITIENPEGSKRREEWPTLRSHYGYIRRTEGGDGEQIDVFVRPGTSPDYSGPVYVVDQVNQDGKFDEHKVMLGFESEEAAKTGYLENFTPDWKIGPVREFASPAEFREWLKNGDTTKPASALEVEGEERAAIERDLNGPSKSQVEAKSPVETAPPVAEKTASSEKPKTATELGRPSRKGLADIPDDFAPSTARPEPEAEHHSNFQPRRKRGDGKGQFKKGKPAIPESQPTAPVAITDRDSFKSAIRSAFTNLSDEQLDTLDVVSDAMAKGFARMTGRSEADFYKQFAEIKGSESDDVGKKALYSRSRSAKGAVEFLEDGRAVIHAFQQHDFSTAVHELAHVARRYLDSDSASTISKWAGFDKAKTRREEVAAEEKFARGFERYLRAGKSPTAELRSAFARIKEWMKEIYRSIKGSPIDINVTKEVGRVFDRMLGADEARKAQAQKLYERRRPQIKDTDDMVAVIRKLGGIRMSEMYAGEIRRLRDGRLKQPGVFTNSGTHIDDMLVALGEQGFRVETVNDLLEMLDRASLGEKIYSDTKDWHPELEKELQSYLDSDISDEAEKIQSALGNPDSLDALNRISAGEATDEDFSTVQDAADLDDDFISALAEEAASNQSYTRPYPESPTEAPRTEASQGALLQDVEPARTPGEEEYRKRYGHDLSIVTEAQQAGLTTDEFSRVHALYESLQQQGQKVDDYLRQGGLFGETLNNKQKDLLRELDKKTRRSKNKAEQGSLLDTSPTLESEIAKREQKRSDDSAPFTLFQDEQVPVRFEAGKKLSPDERKEVLRSVRDAYKEAKLQKEPKGVNEHGDEILGYPHRPDLFIKSDITGRGIRHYITLPDGRKAHPSELFPDIAQSEIDKALLEEQAAQQKTDYLNSRRDARIADSKNDANAKYTASGRKIPDSFFMQHPDGRFVRVDSKDAADEEYFKGKGFERLAPKPDVLLQDDLPASVRQGLEDFADSFIEEGITDKADFLSKAKDELGERKAWALPYLEQIWDERAPQAEANAPTETTQPEERATGIKNAVTASERESRGQSEVEVFTRRTFGQAFGSGKRMVDSGEIDPRTLAESLAFRPRTLSAEESAALIYDRMRLQNEHRAAMDAIEKARQEGDSARELESLARLAQIEEKINTNDEASRRTGYEQGLGLAARRMMIREDYSLARLIQRARVASETGEVSAELRANLERLSKQLEEAGKKLAAAESRISELEANRAFNRARPQSRPRTREVIDKEFLALQSDFAKAVGSEVLFQDDDVQIEPSKLADAKVRSLLNQMARNRIESGAKTLDDVIGELHKTLAPHVDGLTEREVRDALSGFGMTRTHTKSDLTKELDEIKRQARLVSKLEDIEAGKRPESGAARSLDSAEVRQLRREIDKAMRNAGIVPASHEMAAKKSIEKSIAEYERRIREHDLSPRGRSSRLSTAEIGELKAKRDDLKSQLDQIRKAEKEPADPLKAYKKRLEKRKAELEQMLATGQYYTNERGEPTMTKPRTKLELDPEAARLQLEVQRVKSQIEREFDRLKKGRALRMLSGLRKAGLLSSPKTHFRNITGNTAYQIFDEVSRLPGAVADFVMSAATGQRTLTGPSPSASLQSVVAAFTTGRKEAMEILRHGQTREQAEKLQLPQEIDSGIKIIDMAGNAIFRLMAAEDRFFYNAALKRNLLDRAKAQALTETRQGVIERGQVKERTKELADNPSVEMQADAEHDALRATFNNNNKLSDAVKRARSGFSPAVNFAIDMVVPFDRTPTNIIARTLEATPLGFGKNAYQLARAIANRAMTAEEQRNFSQTFGRATVGTGIISLGFKLAAAGLLTGFFDEEKKRNYKKDKAQGKSAVALRVGNQWLQIQSYAPLSALLAVGATAFESVEKESENRAAQMAFAGIKAIGSVAKEQPLLEGPSRLVDAFRSEGSMMKKAGQMAGSFIPTLSSDAAALADSSERAAEGFIPQIQKRVPGLRNLLPAEEGEFRRSWSIDPFQTRTANDSGAGGGRSRRAQRMRSLDR